MVYKTFMLVVEVNITYEVRFYNSNETMKKNHNCNDFFVEVNIPKGVTLQANEIQEKFTSACMDIIYNENRFVKENVYQTYQTEPKNIQSFYKVKHVISF